MLDRSPCCYNELTEGSDSVTARWGVPRVAEMGREPQVLGFPQKIRSRARRGEGLPGRGGEFGWP